MDIVAKLSCACAYELHAPCASTLKLWLKSFREKITCGVPQGSILGPILFVLYINDLASVSDFCFSVLFADDTNMFITGKDMNVLCRQLKEDLRNLQEWLQCNKLSLNVLKTHYMVFTLKN